MNYLLKTNATNKNTLDTEDKINKSIKRLNKTQSRYAEELVAKRLRCENVYEELDLNEIFFKRLDKSIGQNMREYWSS